MILPRKLDGKIRRIGLLVCVVCAFSQASFPLDQIRIEITTDWGRYVHKKWRISKRRLVIIGNHGSYRAEGHSIPAQSVERFLAALNEPLLEKPSLENCAVNVATLAAGLGVSEEEYRHRFETELTSIHLDSEHSLRAVVTIDSKPVVVRSESDTPFMLPWQRDGVNNYNCHISRALDPLLPDGIPTKKLLSDGYLKEVIR